MRDRTTAFGGVALVVALLSLMPSAAAGTQGGPAFGADCDPFALDAPTAAFGSSEGRVSEEAAAAGVAEPNVVEAYQRALKADTRSARMADARVAGPIHVPVYIHVIQPNAGTGVVPQSQIDAQMAVLNNSFRGVTGGDNSAFVFNLVNTDVTINPAWDNLDHGTPEEVAMKTALHEGGARSLNMYLVRLARHLGWATFPDKYSGNPLMDGVVVDSRSVPGGTFAPYNEGDTATHEVGHWIGLFHTFQGGCGPPGDFVADTEPEDGPHFGCPVVNSCPGGGNDPVDNFMSYSDDDCMFRFTAGQTDRMHAQTAQFRNGAPAPVDQAITTAGEAVPVNVHANDPDGDPLSYAVSDQPDHGTLTGSGQTLTYTPNGGYAGPDSFAVQATDTFGATGNSTVTVDVQSGGPVAKSDRFVTLDVSKSKVKKGKKVTFSGQVDAPGNEAVCESGQTVELQRRKPGAAEFQAFKRLQTDATGNFSTKNKLKKTFEYRARVGETPVCGAEESGAKTVKVKKK